MKKKKAETGEICEKCKVKMKVIDQTRRLLDRDEVGRSTPRTGMSGSSLSGKIPDWQSTQRISRSGPAAGRSPGSRKGRAAG